MKIMLSFSYRAELITKKGSHVLQAMVPAEARYNADLVQLDHSYPTNFAHRISDLLKVLNDPKNKPDVLIMTATRDDLCEEESVLIEEIQKQGIRVIGHSAEICKLCGNKQKTKAFLKSIDVPVPNEYNLPSIQKEHLPIVLKNMKLWEGKGISIISEIEQLPKHWDDDDMAEQYIQGIEMSVQVVRYGNKSIVSPPVYKGPTSHQMIHPLKKLRIFPNPWHAKKLNPRIMNMALKIADALNVEGPIDIDLVAANEQDFYVLEINSRLSGVSRMISSAGHNVMDMLISMADGTWKEFSIPKQGVSMEMPVYCNIQELKKQKRLFDYIYIREDIETGQMRNRILISADHYLDLVKSIKPLKDRLQITEADWHELLTLTNAKI